MSYDKFSGYKEKDMKVEESESIIASVDIVTKSGSTDIYISRDHNFSNCNYEGNDIPATIFTVTHPKPGNYTIKIEEKNHSGSYSFS